MRIFWKQAKYRSSLRNATLLALLSLFAWLGACIDTNVENDVVVLSDKTVNSSVKAAGRALLLV